MLDVSSTRVFLRFGFVWPLACSAAGTLAFAELIGRTIEQTARLIKLAGLKLECIPMRHASARGE